MASEFVWDGEGILMHWSVPTATATIYFGCCAAYATAILPKRAATQAPRRDWLGAAHNLALVLFSAWICCNSTALLAAQVSRDGLQHFLCAPVTTPNVSRPPPLAGPLHYWCYLYYASKYYELVDTLLLVLRRKRVILLHALHHGFMPLVMCLLFDGGVSVSLVALSVVNSFVHIVMYAYFLASSLGHKLPNAMRKQITLLQIFQFSVGVIGGTYYWWHYFQNLRITRSWPPFAYDVGCAGGDATTVLIGYISNIALLFMFVQFYRSAYTGLQKHPKKE